MPQWSVKWLWRLVIHNGNGSFLKFHLVDFSWHQLWWIKSLHFWILFDGSFMAKLSGIDEFELMSEMQHTIWYFLWEKKILSKELNWLYVYVGFWNCRGNNQSWWIFSANFMKWKLRSGWKIVSFTTWRFDISVGKIVKT